MGKRTIGLLVVLSLVGLVVWGCGQQVKQEQEEIATQEKGLGATKWSGGVSVQTAGVNTGTISGKVLDSFTADAIPNVTVFTDTKTATTSASGDYTLTGVDAGTITVSAVKDGYNGLSIVSSAETINFYLLKRYDYTTTKPSYPTGTVSGKILDQNGNPLSLTSTEDATYKIYPYAYVSLYSDTCKAYGGSSVNNQGNYTIQNAPAGNISLALQIYKSIYNKQTGSSEYTSELGAFKTGLTLPESGDLSVNLQITSEVATVEGSIPAPSGSSYIYGQVSAVLAKEGFGLSVAYTEISSDKQYSLTLPPNSDPGYALIAQTMGGDNSVGYYGSLAFNYGIQTIAGQKINYDFQLLSPPTVQTPSYRATDLDLAPTFSWTCSWQPDFYGMAIYEKKSDWSSPQYFQWFVLLPGNVTSFKLPSGLLSPQKEYYWGVAAVKSPNSMDSLDFYTLKIEGASYAVGEFKTGKASNVLDYIVVTPSIVTLEVGTTQQFTAKGYDSFGNEVSISPKWQVTSSYYFGGTTAVGTIDAQGLFYANNVGSCRVYATSGGISGFATVEVYSFDNKIGGLSIGMTKSEVETLLGSPDLLTSEGSYKIMKYYKSGIQSEDYLRAATVYNDDSSSTEYQKIGCIIVGGSDIGATEKGGIMIGDPSYNVYTKYGSSTSTPYSGKSWDGNSIYQELRYLRGDYYVVFRVPISSWQVDRIALFKKEWDEELGLTQNDWFKWFGQPPEYSPGSPGSSGVKTE